MGGAGKTQLLRLRRRHEAQSKDELAALACPSYDALRIQSAVLAYIVREGRHEETIIDLAWKFAPHDDSATVERAVRELIGARLLSMEKGKVVPGRAALADHPIT